MNAINLPSSVESIETGAFSNGYGDIGTIKLPRRCKTIHKDAFHHGWWALNAIYCPSPTCPKVYTRAGEIGFNPSEDFVLYVPIGKKELYMSDDYWKQFKIEEYDFGYETATSIAGSWHLKDTSTGQYATYGIGRWGTEANLGSKAKTIDILETDIDGNYYLQFKGQSSYLGQNSWDSQCFADAPQTAYTILEGSDGYLIKEGDKYLTTSYDGTYSVNNIIWGTTATLWELEDVTSSEKKPFPPKLPEFNTIIGEKVSEIETSDEAFEYEANSEWYIICQSRNGESPIYDKGQGETVMRAGADVTPAHLSRKRPADIANYLVRFLTTETGGYLIQFATGRYITDGLKSDSEFSNAGEHLLYSINGEATHFGWNTTDDGSTKRSIVDNNGAGSTLALYGSGGVTSIGGNNDWGIYKVGFSIDVQYVAKMIDEMNGSNPHGYTPTDVKNQVNKVLEKE